MTERFRIGYPKSKVYSVGGIEYNINGFAAHCGGISYDFDTFTVTASATLTREHVIDWLRFNFEDPFDEYEFEETVADGKRYIKIVSSDD